MRAPQSRSTKAAPEDLQERLQAHLFLFSYRVSGDQRRYYQKSLLLSPTGTEALRNTLSGLVSKAESLSCVGLLGHSDLEFELFEPTGKPAESRGRVQFPIDPCVRLVSENPSLGTRSSSTGHIYPPTYERCPVTGNVLRPYITSESFETQSA